MIVLFFVTVAPLLIVLFVRQLFKSRDPLWVRLGWMAAALFGLLSYQNWLSPASGIPAFVIWATMIALLIHLNAENPYGSRTIQAVVYAMVLIAPVAVVFHYVSIRPFVGSVDFFYYVSYARDMLSDAGIASENCYKYFPGVYAFWRNVMTFCGDSMESLQQRYLGVLLFNAILVSAIVFRSTKKIVWAWVALFWYLVVSERFQGFSGTTGPIATLPFLLGVLVWSGQPLRGSRGWLCAVALGIGIGLSLYTRQQAGLLSLGAAALWCNCGFRRGSVTTDNRHQFPILLSLPLISLLTFVAAVLSEGRGLSIVSSGLGTVAAYTPRQSPMVNLYVQLRADEASWLAFGAAAAVWLLLLICRRPTSARWFEVAGFCLIAGAASMVQFLSRPYGHYMLLGLPCFIIAAVVILGHYVEAAMQSLRLSNTGKWLVVCLVVLPLVNSKSRDDAIQLWRLGWPPQQALMKHQWHLQKDVKQDLSQLEPIVSRRDSMYVYPPRHNSPYLLLGTRGIAKTGYGFIAPKIEALPFNKLKWILIIEAGRDETDRAEFSDGEAIKKAAMDRGFRLAVKLKTMTLLRK